MMYGGFVEVTEVQELMMRKVPSVPKEVVRQKEMLLKLRKKHRRRRRAIKKAAWQMFAWEAHHLGKRWVREALQVFEIEQEADDGRKQI